jgi:S-methylmethionine-dependent homocysteine/selenocysteine methylase
MDQKEEERHGVSLFKIDYEIDGQDSIWSAGIVAETSEQAVKSLATFLKNTMKNFKGFKIDTLSWQGAVHHLSENVREKIVAGSKPQKIAKEAKDSKKSILNKDKK